MSTSREQKLKPETTDKLNKIDNSIVYWSLQLGKATVQIREIEAQIGGLYDFKKTAVLEDLKAQGVDLEKENCDVVTVDASTVRIVSKEPQQPQPLEMQRKPGE